MMKNKSIIAQLIQEHPEIKEEKKGFPNIGKREDGLPFGNAVQKIEEAWYFYDSDLYQLQSKTNIIKLGSGNPISYHAFPPAIKNLKKTLKNSLFEYPEAAGNEKHRQLIAEYFKKQGFPTTIDYHHVIITNSTTAGFYLLLKALFRPYDVIIMTAPNYGLFAFMPERLNITVELISLEKEENYKINPKKLKQKIQEINQTLRKKYKNKLNYIPKVRAFFHMNPHNPLGTVLSAKDQKILQELGKVCFDENIWLIDDLVYQDLTYDHHNLAKPVATITKYFDHTISLFGLSKSYGLAKTRTGLIIANETVIRLLRDQLFYMMDSPSILQSSLLAGTYNPSRKTQLAHQKYFQKLIPIYQRNCFLSIALVEGIESIKDTKYYWTALKLIQKFLFHKRDLKQILEGIPFAKVVTIPESGFFLLIDFTNLKKNNIINTEKELLDFLYENCGTKFLIGQSFSWPNSEEMIVRITYSLEPKILIEALSRINLAIRERLNETNRSNY